jgi:hypothetical protein
MFCCHYVFHHLHLTGMYNIAVYVFKYWYPMKMAIDRSRNSSVFMFGIYCNFLVINLFICFPRFFMLQWFTDFRWACWEKHVRHCVSCALLLFSFQTKFEHFRSFYKIRACCTFMRIWQAELRLTDRQTGRETDRQTDRLTNWLTGWLTERDRQAGRQTDRQRQTNRQAGRQTDRQTDRQAGRQTDWLTDWLTDREKNRKQAGKQADRPTGKQTDRQQADRQADRQTDRPTDRQTDRQAGREACQGLEVHFGFRKYSFQSCPKSEGTSRESKQSPSVSGVSGKRTWIWKQTNRQVYIACPVSSRC